MLCDGDQLVDVLRQGQGVLNVLPLAGVKDDIDAQLVPLDDDAVAAGPAPGDLTWPEHSPLDAVHRELGRPDGAVRRLGDAARVPDRHDRRAHGLPRRAPSCSTSRTSARCRSAGAGALEHAAGARCPTTSARSHPGRAQYTHLLDDADGSVLDDIIVWWHPGDGGRRLRRDAERVEHRSCPRRPSAVARRRTSGPCSPCRARRRSSGWRPCSPRRPPSVGSASPTPSWSGVPCVVAGTGYTGERGVEIAVPADRRRRPVGGDRRRRHHAGRARRSRHAAPRGRAAAARPRARPGHHAAAGRARLGRGVGQAVVPRQGRAGGRAGRRRRPPPRRHRHRGPSPAARRVRRARRRRAPSAR